MALPGGDPIAAALAAGETPSPEMVAASQEKEGFSPRVAIVCFLGVLLSLIIGLWISENTSFLARAPLPIPPDALADRAQLLLKTIGYPEEPQSRDYGFTCCEQQAMENSTGIRSRGAARSWPAIAPLSVTSVPPASKRVAVTRATGPFYWKAPSRA